MASYTLELKYTNNSELLPRLAEPLLRGAGIESLPRCMSTTIAPLAHAGVRQAFADLVYDNDLIDFDPASLELGRRLPPADRR